MKSNISTSKALKVMLAGILSTFLIFWAIGSTRAQTVKMLELQCTNIEGVDSSGFGILDTEGNSVDTVFVAEKTFLVIPRIAVKIQRPDQKPVQLHAGIGLNDSLIAIFGYDGELSPGGYLIRFNRKIYNYDEVRDIIATSVAVAGQKNWLATLGMIRSYYGFYR